MRFSAAAMAAALSLVLAGCAGADSSGADSSGADSSGADSSGADSSGADLAAAGSRGGAGAQQLTVLAAFYPYAFAAGRIGGGEVTVDLLTPPGAEPHDLELSPRQVLAVGQADLVVYQKGFQPALDDAIEQQGPARVLEIGDALGVSLDTDPHVWLDPRRMREVASDLTESLAAVDPEHAAGYRTRGERLGTELHALDEEFAEGLADCERDVFVVNHDAFGRMAARYDLEQVPISGLSPAAEPSPRRIAELADLISGLDVSTIYTETLASPRLAETLAAETGARTAVLNPLEGLEEGSGEDYFSVMRENLTALQSGLDCA